MAINNIVEGKRSLSRSKMRWKGLRNELESKDLDKHGKENGRPSSKTATLFKKSVKGKKENNP